MPPCRPPPYILPPILGEMLSSWFRRIAAEYGVDLRHLTAHFGLSVSRAWEIDRALPTDDVHRVAMALRTDPAEICEMVHVTGTRALHPTFVPLQVCSRCRADHQATTRLPITLRAWFEFWQIECERCRTPFSPTGRPNLKRCNPAREEPVWFESLRPAARQGARLLANFARRPLIAGSSPVAILRLLSMRFDAIRFAKGPVACLGVDEQFATRRLAELFVPGLSERWERQFGPGTLDLRQARPPGDGEDDPARRDGNLPLSPIIDEPEFPSRKARRRPSPRLEGQVCVSHVQQIGDRSVQRFSHYVQKSVRREEILIILSSPTRCETPCGGCVLGSRDRGVGST